MIWLRAGRTTSRGRTRGNLRERTTLSFASTTSSLLASWSVLDHLTSHMRFGENVNCKNTKQIAERLKKLRKHLKFFGDARGPRGLFWTNMSHFGPPLAHPKSFFLHFGQVFIMRAKWSKTPVIITMANVARMELTSFRYI